MKKIKQTIYIFMFIVFFFILTSCDEYHLSNKVKEFSDEVVNKKLSELEIEFNNMYEKLVEYNILSSSLDKNYSKKQEFNGKEYYLHQPRAFPSSDYVEDKYLLLGTADFSFSIYYENIKIWLTKEYNFFEQLEYFSLTILNANCSNVEYDHFNFSKFNNELKFFSEYLNLDKDLTKELNKYFDKIHLIDDFNNNKSNINLQDSGVQKKHIFSLTPSTKIKYIYSVIQNNDTLLYDSSFGISYYKTEGDI